MISEDQMGQIRLELSRAFGEGAGQVGLDPKAAREMWADFEPLVREYGHLWGKLRDEVLHKVRLMGRVAAAQATITAEQYKNAARFVALMERTWICRKLLERLGTEWPEPLQDWPRE